MQPESARFRPRLTAPLRHDPELKLLLTVNRTRRTIKKVFALGLFAKPLTDEQRKRILPKEVPDTLRLYLEGKIDQFWFRVDKPGGVVFLMEARSIIEALPLAANGYLSFQYIPVGPLRPLGLLIESPQPE